jgi:hypothetical protein
MTTHKKQRNVVFIICGIVMFAALIALLIMRLILGGPTFNSKPIVFILESVMLAAFGVSWLVKGETMWRDKIQTASIES